MLASSTVFTQSMVIVCKSPVKSKRESLQKDLGRWKRNQCDLTGKQKLPDLSAGLLRYECDVLTALSQTNRKMFSHFSQSRHYRSTENIRCLSYRTATSPITWMQNWTNMNTKKIDFEEKDDDVVAETSIIGVSERIWRHHNV